MRRRRKKKGGMVGNLENLRRGLGGGGGAGRYVPYRDLCKGC